MAKLKNPSEIEVPKDIRAAAIRGRLTFFIGNGVSRLYDIPSWDELANRMLNCLVKNGKMNHSAFDILSRLPTKTKISIADYYFKDNFDKEKNPALSYKEILMRGISKEHIKGNPTYSLIAKCRVKFLTTNYDPLLADALNEEPSAEVIESAALEVSEKMPSKGREKTSKRYDIYNHLDDFKKADLLRSNFLIHLHGSISDDKTLIASTKDYLNHYGDPDRQEMLSLLFENQTVVFIGYGLEELEVLDLIIKASRSRGVDSSQQPRFFLLLSLLSHEAEILQFLTIYYEQLGVTLVPYCRDQEGFHALNGIIDRWSKELAGLCQEPSRSDNVNVIDNLLSEFDRISK